MWNCAIGLDDRFVEAVHVTDRENDDAVSCDWVLRIGEANRRVPRRYLAWCPKSLIGHRGSPPAMLLEWRAVLRLIVGELVHHV